MILRAAEFGGNKHALVYLLATSLGGLAVTAFSSNPSTQSVAHFAALDLPDLTEGLLAELVESKLESGTQLIVIGGFSWAQGDNGFYRLLANDRSSYLKGASFREFAALLHTICGENAKASALDMAAQRTLSIPELAATVDQPLNQLIYKQGEFQILVNTLEHFFLQYELKKCMNVLNDVAFRPLTEWLCRESVESVTLIPCGWLAAFPLTAVEIAPGQTMSDLFATSVAPNARSLSYDEYTTGKRSGIYALGDPRPSFQELRWGEAEAYALSNLARDIRLPTEVKVQHKATRDWLIHALQKGYIVNASCHGVFDIHAPLQSALLLAQGENLTLGAILSNEADLRGLRLLILSLSDGIIRPTRSLVTRCAA